MQDGGVPMTTIGEFLDAMTIEGELVQKNDDLTVRCLACGHRCLIRDGRRGVCRVRFSFGQEEYYAPNIYGKTKRGCSSMVRC